MYYNNKYTLNMKEKKYVYTIFWKIKYIPFKAYLPGPCRPTAINLWKYFFKHTSLLYYVVPTPYLFTHIALTSYLFFTHTIYTHLLSSLHTQQKFIFSPPYKHSSSLFLTHTIYMHLLSFLHTQNTFIFSLP